MTTAMTELNPIGFDVLGITDAAAKKKDEHDIRHYVSHLSQLGCKSASDCKWAHACNTIEACEENFRLGVDFVESDVVYHPGSSCVLVAHSEHDVEDIPEVINARRCDVFLKKFFSLPRTVGLKLDFKVPNAVPECMQQLHDKWETNCQEQPVGLNADVLTGPRGVDRHFQGQSVDQFIEYAKQLPVAVLSLGWRTSDPPATLRSHQGGPGSLQPQDNVGDVEIGYSDAMIDDMLQLCTAHSLQNFNVTFAVRACDVIKSLPQMKRLLQQSDLWSLTVWNGREGVSEEQEAKPRFVQLLMEIGLSTTYMPRDLASNTPFTRFPDYCVNAHLPPCTIQYFHGYPTGIGDEPVPPLYI